MQRYPQELRDMLEKLIGDPDFRESVDRIILERKVDIKNGIKGKSEIFEAVAEHIQIFLAQQRGENIDKLLDE